MIEHIWLMVLSIAMVHSRDMKFNDILFVTNLPTFHSHFEAPTTEIKWQFEEFMYGICNFFLY